jgi:GT2 family glycosyltransferase
VPPVSRPHVTLALLSRNRPECLARALQAATSGRELPNDIIVSDDSDDAIRPAVRDLVSQFPSVRYTEGPRAGLGANENHLVANLLPEAEWVVFNGDDARWPPEFLTTLRDALQRYAGQRCLPSGTEIRNGAYVVPSRLSFFGFQERAYKDYSPGAQLETIVGQATAFPAEPLRRVRFVDVSLYGFDEVDMAYKMRKLGWTIVFEPSIQVLHDQSETDRESYPTPVQIARLYFRPRSFSVYRRRPLHLSAFLLLAPLHLAGAHAKRRDWEQLRRLPSTVLRAYGAWLRSLRADWRLG